jgi:hypothetical protein
MIPFPLGSLDGSTRKSAMLRAWSTVILIAGLAMACMLLVMVPAESWPGQGCLMRKHAGIHCPGCGGTRAARHLVQGSWREASRSNLLIFPVADGILWGIVAFSANRWTGTRWRTPMVDEEGRNQEGDEEKDECRQGGPPEGSMLSTLRCGFAQRGQK